MVKIDKNNGYLKKIRLEKDKIESLENFPFNLPAVKNLDELAFHPKVTYLIGENGSGKSTLLEAIASKLNINAEGGSRNFNFTTRDSLSDLDKYLILSKYPKHFKDVYFLRAESYFNVATEIERLDKEPDSVPIITYSGSVPIITYYGGKSLHEQSHGESFLAFCRVWLLELKR